MMAEDRSVKFEKGATLQTVLARSREALADGHGPDAFDCLEALVAALSPSDYEYGVYVGGGCMRPEDDAIDDLAAAVDRMHELAVDGTEAAKAGGYGAVEPVQLVAYTREALAMHAGAPS